MEIIVEKIVPPSHVVQPPAWSEFFIHFRGNGKAGPLHLGLMQLPFAILIVVLHNVWHGFVVPGDFSVVLAVPISVAFVSKRS